MTVSHRILSDHPKMSDKCYVMLGRGVQVQKSQAIAFDSENIKSRIYTICTVYFTVKGSLDSRSF